MKIVQVRRFFWFAFSRIWTEYGDFLRIPIFSPNTGKYGPAKIPYLGSLHTVLSCIDLIITTSPNSLQNISTFCKGLSDFHKFIVTVLKTSFRKVAPNELHYRHYNIFNANNFKTEFEAKFIY